MNPDPDREERVSPGGEVVDSSTRDASLTPGEASEHPRHADVEPEELIRMLPEMAPEEIIAILRDYSFPEGFKSDFVSAYRDYLCSVDDVNLLIAHISNFTREHSLADTLREIGEMSPAVTPDTIAEIATALQSEEVARLLGQGLKGQLRKIANQEEKRALAQAYLDAGIGGALAGEVIASLTRDLAPSRGSEISTWLLDLPDDMTLSAEAEFMQATVPTGPEEGEAYILRLLESGNVSRAVRAMGAFLGAYMESNPEQAARWAMELPPELGDRRRDFISSTYTTLANIDKARADAILDEYSIDPTAKDKVIIRFDEHRHMFEKLEEAKQELLRERSR